jgi:hypothetical protein
MLRGLVTLRLTFPAPADSPSQAKAKVVAGEITVKARSTVQLSLRDLSLRY